MGSSRNVYIKDDDLDAWVVNKIGENRFRNYSHAVETALRLLRRKEAVSPVSTGAF